MAGAGPLGHRAARTLAGATVLQAVPALADDRIGRAALDLALALLRAGARAIVAGGGGQLVGELQAVGGEWMEFAFAGTQRLRRRGQARAWRALLETERVELLHAHGTEIVRHLVAGARHAAIPFAVTCYRLPGQRASAPFRADPLRGAQAILAPSRFAAELIVRRHAVAAERVGVVAHSLDTARFDPAAVRADRVAAVRHAWRVRPHERVILAPSRPGGPHEQLTLIDAARILVNGGLRDVVFVLLGARGDDDDGENDENGHALDERIAAQGLGGVFRRTGHGADRPAAYAAADLVVLPAERPVAFEEAAAEALAMGCPVIAAAVGALPEIIAAPPRVAPADRTGWLTKPREPFDLARALAAALAVEREPLQAICHRARQFAERKFSPLRIAEATLAVYAALLEDAR